MRNVLLIVGLILCYTMTSAQIIDDFQDADLNIAPTWFGMQSAFTTSNGALRSASTNPNASFYLSTQFGLNGDLTWNLKIKLLFNTSSLNYTDVYLMADSMNLAKSNNAYFVRFGGSQDEISLYKTFNKTTSKILDGTDAVLNSSNNNFELMVHRKGDTFTLSHLNLNTQKLTTEGLVEDKSFYQLPYCGIVIRQSTSTFFGKHYFDDLYIGPPVRDTIAPVLDSVKCLNSKSIGLYFNEPMDSWMMNKAERFHLNGERLQLDSMTNALDHSFWKLYVNAQLKPNFFYEMEIDSVGDLFKNLAFNINKSFICLEPSYPLAGDLLIDELMVDPEPSVGLPEREYIELRNVSNKFISLKNCSLRDPGSKIDLPPIVLFPDSFHLIYNGPSLNNSEDQVSLYYMDTLLHVVKYDLKTYQDPNKANGGYSIEMIDPHQICLKGNWKASVDVNGGTPGRVNSVDRRLPQDTAAPKITSMVPLDGPSFNLTFDELPDLTQSSSMSFYLNSMQLNPIVSVLNDTTLVVSVNSNIHTDSIYKLTIGGFMDCSGNRSSTYSYMIQWPTDSKVSDLMFNEVLFNPKSGGSDFIELFNNSNHVLNLKEHYIASIDDFGSYMEMYQLTEKDILLRPKEYVLISEDIAGVCKQYNCGTHSNIRLKVKQLPSMSDDYGRLSLVNVGGDVIDSMTYSAHWHFEKLDDKEGISLEKVNPMVKSGNKFNWHSAAFSSGFATPAKENSQFVHEIKTEKPISLSNNIISPDLDGKDDLCIIRYQLNEADAVCTAEVYDLSGQLIKSLLNHMTIGTEGQFAWDGTDNNGQIPATGIYVLLLELRYANGKSIKEHLTLILVN